MKKKMINGILLISIIFLMCRCSLLEYSFPIGISLITTMMSIKSKYGYLAIIIVLAIATKIPEGYDVTGYIIGTVLCLIVFIVLQRADLNLWQMGIIAGSLNIITICIYSFAVGSIYKLNLQRLICESVTIIVLVILFDIAASMYLQEKCKSARNSYAGGALTVIGVLAVSGAGASFLVWPIIIAFALFLLIYKNPLNAFLAISLGACAAELAGEGDFGVMANLVIVTAVVGALGKKMKLLKPALFAVGSVCVGMIDSGVVLVVNTVEVVIPVIVMTVIILCLDDLAEKAARFTDELEGAAKNGLNVDCIRQKSEDMEILAQMYDSYIDSRTILADQFRIMKQLLDDSSRRMKASDKTSVWEKKDKLEVDIAMSQCAANGNICGDCCGWQDIGENRVAMVISDGMGKGKKAASESLMVTKTMLLLLKSGVAVDLALKLINSVMVIKNDEDSYATLDLTIIDKISGKTKLYKIGAAPTLIRHGDDVDEVELSAVPLGVVNGIKVKYVETYLKKGDWLVMMSDGVSDGGGKKISIDTNEFLGRIKKILREMKSNDSENAVEIILSFAADSYVGRERDDLTVMVARLM